MGLRGNLFQTFRTVQSESWVIPCSGLNLRWWQRPMRLMETKTMWLEGGWWMQRMVGARRSPSRFIWQTKPRLFGHLRVRQAGTLRTNHLFGWTTAAALQDCHSYRHPGLHTWRPTHRLTRCSATRRLKIDYLLYRIQKGDRTHCLLYRGVPNHGSIMVTARFDVPRTSAQKRSYRSGILDDMSTESTTSSSSAVRTAPSNSEHEMTI